MLHRFGVFAALITAAAAALYEYEDGVSAFSWLHSILAGMNLAVATAASILTVCGLRACTNGMLRDTLAQPMRWRGLIQLLADDVTAHVLSELQRSDGDDEDVWRRRCPSSRRRKGTPH